MPGFTCCGAGDIHEAKPDYYLHLNARILGQAEQLGADTLLTICNVCTLNLRQANMKLQADPELRERVNKNLREVGAAAYHGTVEVRHLLWEIAEGEGYERLKQSPSGRSTGRQGRAVLRLPDPAAVQDPGLRGSRQAPVARAHHPGLRRRAGRLPGEDQVLRVPDRAGPRGGRAGRADPAAGEAKEAGADVMVTPCPLCHLSLDAWQGKASKEADKEFDMPIFHLAQLVGAAAGLSYDELQFKRHVTKAHPATDKIYAAQ